MELESSLHVTTDFHLQKPAHHKKRILDR